jgi:hypothetical protein
VRKRKEIKELEEAQDGERARGGGLELEGTQGRIAQ